ncbi:MAG: BatA domain-containing protein [Planctomycetaceae bacterium]|nr:BatA domain-containing protein [Planctomycetaceae bacterium]
MTFVNISLLAGTALVALPILLHLIMRRRPTLLEFPAMRFLQKRADANKRRLRIRHWLLLALRAAVIALLALALARPSIRWSGASGSQEAPVAAVLLFDAAPHMEYRHQNQTRLDAARQLGLWLLGQLPEQSEVGVLDTRLGSAPAFQADRGAARQRVERLETVGNSQPMPVAIEQAVKLLRQSRWERKELYVFTDLSRGAWPESAAERLHRQLAAAGDLGLYVIDVGVARPTDCGLGVVRLSGEVLSNAGSLALQSDVSCVGAASTRAVDLYVLDADRKPQKRSQQSCDAAPGELRPVEFRIGGLKPGVHQGFVRLVGQDGLAADDLRYFTVVVRPAWPVLIVAPSPAAGYGLFLSEALAPAAFRKQGQARFRCDTCDLEHLDQQDLSPYAAVWLLDPTPMKPEVWKKLTDYAADGHGVGVALGRNASPIDTFNDAAAQEILAGRLLRQSRRPDGDVHLAPRDEQHPALSAFRSRAGETPWMDFPVFRYWEIERPPAGTSVVIPLSNGAPAVLERAVGRGRALTWTTPMSDPLSRRDAWNRLPDGWPFLVLANQMTGYLVGGGQSTWNYWCGQTVALPVGGGGDARRNYLLFTPDGLSFPVTADLQRRELSITATDLVGNYRVQSGGQAGVEFGFSVNYAPNQTQLDRLTSAELSAMFGPVKFRLARDRQEIDRDVNLGRVGRELFSPLIVLVALLLAAESWMANRFYRTRSKERP